jgi:hypothetical protein
MCIGKKCSIGRKSITKYTEGRIHFNKERDSTNLDKQEYRSIQVAF